MTTPLISEVAEIRKEIERLMDAYWGVSGHNRDEKRPIYSEAILQLLKDKLPKEKVVEPPVGEPWHIRGYDVGYDAAINEIRELLGDGNEFDYCGICGDGGHTAFACPNGFKKGDGTK